MHIRTIKDNFSDLHEWLKGKYKLAEPTLSQVAASLVQSYVIANGVPVKIATGDPLEVGFISRRSDGELHGSLDINVSFDGPLDIQSEE